jgi:glucan 1,3-beta-glucosidase
MPTDPREADGTCGNTDPWNPPLQPWQTGGAGAGSIAESASVALAWPPVTISGGGEVTLLPTYTPTGAIPTLPAPSLTATASINVGDGWENPADTAGLMVAIPSCSYLNPWVGPAAPPSPLCSGGTTAHAAAATPSITPPPA